MGGHLIHNQLIGLVGHIAVNILGHLFRTWAIGDSTF